MADELWLLRLPVLAVSATVEAFAEATLEIPCAPVRSILVPFPSIFLSSRRRQAAMRKSSSPAVVSFQIHTCHLLSSQEQTGAHLRQGVQTV